MSTTEVTDGHVVLTVTDDRVAYMGSLGWRRVTEEPDPAKREPPTQRTSK